MIHLFYWFIEFTNTPMKNPQKPLQCDRISHKHEWYMIIVYLLYAKNSE